MQKDRGPLYDSLLREQALIIDVIDELNTAMQAQNLSQAQVAKKIGRSPADVSNALQGGKALTLGTIADIAYALGLRPSFMLCVNTNGAGEPKARRDK